MTYHFSKRSLDRLQTCHEDLQKIAKEALSLSDIDFAVTEGHRSVVRQRLLYATGKSKIDGQKKKSKHNHFPAQAFDIVACIRGKTSYQECYLAYLGGVLMTTAQRLLNERQTTHALRWGGNWDQDGEIVTDQNFVDMPHFELCSPSSEKKNA